MRTAVADDEPDRPVEPVTVTVWPVVNTTTSTWVRFDDQCLRQWPTTTGPQPRWTCS